MNLSNWTRRIRAETGIIDLMQDLGFAVASEGKPLYVLGGGNPAHIPQVEKYFQVQMEHIVRSSRTFGYLVGDYAGPQGSNRFVCALANLFRSRFGWDIGPENIALGNGSQMVFTILFRFFSGEFADGQHKRIFLPISPEYIGYNEADEEKLRFRSVRPKIIENSDSTFKYEIDFSKIHISDDIGAICISRPTNPTGNVVTDEEVRELTKIAKQNQIPLIIDGAYGLPFPGIVYTDCSVEWNENTILVLSLSKLGLPGARTGILIAQPEIIELFACANAIMTLATGNFGAVLALKSVESGEILDLSHNIIQPYYRSALDHAVSTIRNEMHDLPYMLHQPEGAFFLWLWFPGLPISDQELYQRLKQRNVYVVPGNCFFPGLEGEWQHRHECIRLSYAGSQEVVSKGVAIIADEVRRAHNDSLSKRVA